MARGGKRAGAGRRPGTINQRTQEIAAKALEGGITPLEYMLGVMRDETADYARRDDMAKASAPFLHARLAAVEVSGNKDQPLKLVVQWASE